MQEETKRIESSDNQPADMKEDYLSAITEMKKNSVARSDYDSLRAENKRLLDAIVNGQTASTEVVEEVKKPTLEDHKRLCDDLFSDPDKTFGACEYIDKALQLREAAIQNGMLDPFVDIGKSAYGKLTQDDFYRANETARVYQECLDYAQGDDEVFINELMRRTTDTSGLKPVKPVTAKGYRK